MTRIPRVLHYCFGLSGRDKPWSLVHYACIKSALVRIRPEAAFFYYEHEPRGIWWQLTKKLVTAVQIKAPTEIFGRPLTQAVHRADVIRLERLLKQGGIYLDVDVLVVRDFDPLLDESCVLGKEGADGTSGLCNAVILAEKNSAFIRRWYDSYKSFRGKDGYWNEHSVKMPQQLAAQYPDELRVLDHKSFYWPLWDEEGLELLFCSNTNLEAPDAYAHHLWESKSWDFLENLSVAGIRERDTNFHRLIRPFVAEFPNGFGAPNAAVVLGSKAKRTLRNARRFARRRLGI